MGAFNEDATKTLLLLRKSNFEEQKWKIFCTDEEEKKNLENGPSSPFVLKRPLFLQNFPGEFP